MEDNCCNWQSSPKPKTPPAGGEHHDVPPVPFLMTTQGSDLAGLSVNSTPTGGPRPPHDAGGDSCDYKCHLCPEQVANHW